MGFSPAPIFLEKEIMSAKIINLDFETRSAVDIKKAGAWRYSIDESTEVLCFAYRIDGGPIKLWSPFFQDFEEKPGRIPEDLFQAIGEGATVYAWNSFFEFSIWNNVLTAYRGFMTLPLNRFMDTAAKASALALPRNLADSSIALGLPVEKDMAGRRLMLKMSKPRRARQDEKKEILKDKNIISLKDNGFLDTINDKEFYLYHEDPKDFMRLFDYCKKDVEVESAIAAKLEYLPWKENELWLFDQRINLRGVPIDTLMVKKSLGFLSRYFGELLKELVEITDSEVTTANQRKRILEWLETRGVFLEGLTKDDVIEALKDENLDDKSRRVLEIRQLLGKTSIKKLESMLACVDPSDNRVRGTLLYHGASTGRWCLASSHEVLTPSGWKNLDEWKGEPIAVFEPKDKSISFEVCDINAWEYDGKMVAAKNQNLSFLVTPEHKLPGVTSKNNFQVKEAQNIKRFDLLLSGTLPLAKDDLKTRILVMAQADGHFSIKKEWGRFLRFRFKKSRKIDRCEELLSAAGIPFSKVERADATEIKTPFRDIPKWLWDFREKKFDLFFSQINPRVFVEELPKWDGHKQEGLDSFEYSTNDHDNALFAVTMAHLSGKAARIVPRIPEEKNWSTNYRVYVRAKDKARIQPEIISYPHYSGRVFCPETSTGFFMTRYDGKISITGNSGKLIQPQNFPRGSLKEEEVKLAFDRLNRGGYENFRKHYPDLLDAISSMLRGFIKAKSGKEFVSADFSSIESRALFWLSDDEEGLRIYSTHGKIYEEMAGAIYNKKYTEIKKGTFERQLGKQATLGCGFGMGHKKFGITCEGYGMDVSADLAKFTVTAFRAKFPGVVKFWHELERAATMAVKNPGKAFSAGKKIAFKTARGFLWARLPNGRFLAYYKPRLKVKTTPWGEQKLVVTYMGTNSQTKKWERQSTYGGKLCENVTQAVARDLMAEAMVRLEDKGYPVVMTVHDEVVSEVPEGLGTVNEFELILNQVPKWGKGIPVESEGWRGRRFKK